MRDTKTRPRARFGDKIPARGINRLAFSVKHSSRHNRQSSGIQILDPKHQSIPRWRRLVRNTQHGSNAPEQKIVKFKASTPEIIKSIIDQTPLEGIDISVQVQDPLFRFQSLSESEQKYSLQLSEAFALTVQRAKTRDTRPAIERSIERRVDEADDFAIRMYPVIQEMKSEAGVITNKGMIELLNSKNIPTYKKGGKWHTSTLNNMKKRWTEMGIVAGHIEPC